VELIAVLAVEIPAPRPVLELVKYNVDLIAVPGVETPVLLLVLEHVK
jgi:hypothetical protein